MAVEHAMFTFDDLKVASRDDRMTDRMTTKVLSSRPRIKCGETNNPDVKSILNYSMLIENPNLEVVLTFYVGMLKMINKEVDNETLAVLKQYMYIPKSALRRTDDLAMSSTLLRCLYEHNSLLCSISLPFENSVHTWLWSQQF